MKQNENNNRDATLVEMKIDPTCHHNNLRIRARLALMDQKEKDTAVLLFPHGGGWGIQIPPQQS